MEVLFICDTTESHQVSCSAWDIRTGTNMMNYKGAGSIGHHGFHVMKSNYIIGSSFTKPLLHVWPINSQELLTSVRFVLPGKVNAFSISPDGLYLVAGILECFYIWHLSSGRMLTKVSKHYQQIDCIVFNDNSSHFVTAARDGSILVWNLTKLVTNDTYSDTPLYSFTDHGLPVTDIYLGKGGIRCFLYSVSLDRTCKIYDLSSGTLLINIVFTEALTSIVTNILENNVYVGTEEGQIYEVGIDALPRNKECSVYENQTNTFVGHKKGSKVSSLVLSLDGQTLISGGEDENVYIWHIPSRQLIKKMSFKGKITNMLLRLSNPEIFQPEHKQPPIFTKSLKRMVDADESNDMETIDVMITRQAKSVETQRKGQYLYIPTSAPTESENENKAKISQLEEEIERLKHVNKELFDLSAKAILRRNKEKSLQHNPID